MAKPGTKAAKKRDPRRPDEWPVNEFPYAVIKPNEEYPTYHRTVGEAVRKLIGQVEKTREQFRNIDSDVVERCNHVIAELKKIGEEGGSVRHMIDTYYEVWYQADVLRRAQYTEA